jgi:DNA modification methylase
MGAVQAATVRRASRPSSLIDTRVIYCGDNLEQLAKLPDGCIDLVYIDPPFNSNRNYEVFWGERVKGDAILLERIKGDAILL